MTIRWSGEGVWHVEYMERCYQFVDTLKGLIWGAGRDLLLFASEWEDHFVEPHTL